MKLFFSFLCLLIAGTAHAQYLTVATHFTCYSKPAQGPQGEWAFAVAGENPSYVIALRFDHERDLYRLAFFGEAEGPYPDVNLTARASVFQDKDAFATLIVEKKEIPGTTGILASLRLNCASSPHCPGGIALSRWQDLQCVENEKLSYLE